MKKEINIDGNITLRLNNNGKQWTLLKSVKYDFCYETEENGEIYDKCWTIVVPVGATTDMASVPWFGRWLIPNWRRQMVKAALVHDYLYRTGGENGKYTKREADGMFFDVLDLVSPMPRWKKALAWAAVRIMPGGKW